MAFREPVAASDVCYRFGEPARKWLRGRWMGAGGAAAAGGDRRSDWPIAALAAGGGGDRPRDDPHRHSLHADSPAGAVSPGSLPRGGPVDGFHLWGIASGWHQHLPV